MSDVWTTVFNSSTLGAGHDFYEHLHAQNIGGGSIILEGFGVEVGMAEFDVEVTEQQQYSVDVLPIEYDVLLEGNEYTVEVE